MDPGSEAGVTEGGMDPGSEAGVTGGCMGPGSEAGVTEGGMGSGSEAGVTEGCLLGRAVNLSSRAKTRDPLRAPVICKGQR
jgi:hypothetical protein